MSIITEVILKVLTKPELSDEERESKEELLYILEQHMLDVSAYVRCKVISFWAKLQTENAIPTNLQSHILGKVIVHLRDKAALVRKQAANCVTIFLTHNVFDFELPLSALEKQYNELSEKLAILKLRLHGIDHKKVKEVLAEWEKRKNDILAVVQDKIEVLDEVASSQASSAVESEATQENLPEVMRECIWQGRYEEAVKMCLNAGKSYQQWLEARETMDDDEMAELLLELMKNIFTDVKPSNATQEVLANEEQLKSLAEFETKVEVFEQLVVYLRHLDSAIEPMVELIQSATIGDMQEAVNFFTAAYQFKIERAKEGLYGGFLF